MQRTATRSTSCRTNVETETLILSQVVHQVQEPAGRPVGTPLAFRWQRDSRKQLVERNTRQESNLRALGSKPNGDAGNPRLVYWLRRQESDLRGLRSERSRDASPRVESPAARTGCRRLSPGPRGGCQ
jgi:hypothetical protein